MEKKAKIFHENKNSVFYAAFRVSIQGAEVTQFIVDEGISIHYSDRDGFNSATFTLSNPFFNFVLRPENFGVRSRPDNPLLPSTESLPNPVWRGPLNTELHPIYSEIPKKQIYDYKQQINWSFETEGTAINVYDFIPGQLIINKNDPVRIFLHNPMKEAIGKTDEEWIPIFTGFIENHPEATDYYSGKSTISINCNCIKKMLQRMRTSLNPISQFTEEQRNTLRSDKQNAYQLFADVAYEGLKDGVEQHPLANKDFFTAMLVLLLGARDDVGEFDDTRVGFLGLGEVWKSGIQEEIDPVVIDILKEFEQPETNENKKEVKDFVVDVLKAKREGTSASALSEKYPVFNEDKIKYLSEKIEIAWNYYNENNTDPVFKVTKYTVDSLQHTSTSTNTGGASDASSKTTQKRTIKISKLGEETTETDLNDWYNLLIFGDLSMQSQVFDDDGVSIGSELDNVKTFYSKKDVNTILKESTTYGKYSPWRMNIHFLVPDDKNAFKRLEDQVLVRAVESREWITRYDAILKIVELLDYQWITTGIGDIVFEIPMYDFLPEDYTSYWEDVFIVDKFALSDSVDTEAGDVVSGLTVSPRISTFISESDSQLTQLGFVDRISVISDVLAAKYGVFYDSYEAPIGKPLESGIENNILKMFAFIEYQKRLANVESLSVNFVLHPYLLPNRNLLYAKRLKIGWITSVDYNINLFQDIQCSVELKFPRNYSEVVNEDGEKFIRTTYFFGGNKMAVSHKQHVSVSLDNLEKEAKKQGIRIITVLEAPKTQVATEEELDKAVKTDNTQTSTEENL